MIPCENCEIEHEGIYGSGRFCSSKCSRTFSTKAKRKEINQKISLSLYKGLHVKICPECKEEFKHKKKRQIYCSNSCSAKSKWRKNEFRNNISRKLALLSNSRDNSFSFGSIKCKFEFNNAEISCDSMKERKSLEYLCSNYNIKNIERCDFIIPYYFNDKLHHYNPDFKINIDNKILILEVKTRISKNKTNKESRPNYFLTVDDKKKALINYCKNNDFSAGWYDGKLQFLNGPLAQLV